MDSKCHVHSFICWLINVPSLMNYILFITSCVKLSVEEFANELLVDKFIQRRLFVETWLYMTICSIVRTPRKCQWQSAFQLHSMRLQLTCLVSHEQLISFFPSSISPFFYSASFFFLLPLGLSRLPFILLFRYCTIRFSAYLEDLRQCFVSRHPDKSVEVR